MGDEATSFNIYDMRTGRLAARIGTDETVQGAGDPEAEATLKALMQQEIVVREEQLNLDPEDEDEEIDLFPEETMCYIDLITLRPGDPRHLKAFLLRLPYVSHYEVRP
ncbi:MAG TPA: hypothetical protein VFA09_00800 [Ktedonobacteraceae bacterium]|nr:hypothetical protein [Ktedonobacteraceae bacterium]